MEKNRIHIVVRVVTDIFLIAILHLSYFLIKNIAHAKMGFFCDDKSIRFPYKTDTISVLLVSVISYGLPILTICVVELAFFLYERHVSNADPSWKKMVSRIYNEVVTFLVAAGACFLLTSVIKFSTGRPRPHFLDVCNPKGLENCVGYQESYTCTIGADGYAMKELFLSFISGHSSVISVGITYAVLYLQARLLLKHAPLIRPLIQITYIAVAFYILISRYTDFKHRPSDILGGALVGIASAIFFFFLYIPCMEKIRL